MKKKEQTSFHLGVYLEGPASREGFSGLDLLPVTSEFKPPDDQVKVFLVPHTHADLCWPEIPDYCMDTCLACIDDLVEFQEQAPGFRFSMEHAYYLRQYLMLHPENTDEITNLLQRGYFECGAFYLGPTELTAGGESLIRELYLGKRWLKERFNLDSKVVWNVDCPGHTQQLPQILKQAGVPYLVIWKEFNVFKHDYSGYTGPCLFRFASPDGSEVTSCFTPGGYGVGRMLGFRDAFDILQDRLPGFLEDVAAHLHQHHLPGMIMIADGTDVERPTLDVPGNIRLWNEKYKYPKINLATSAEFFDQIDPSALPLSQGEAPNWWDTIGSFQNERVMSERRLEPRQAAAEAFCAMASLVSADYEYPYSLLERIWENRLFASEHNSGGRNGRISDEIKLSKVRSARILADIVLNQALAEISLQVEFKQPGIPVLLFNSLVWTRKDMAVINLHFSKGEMKAIRVIDLNGIEIQYQFESISFHKDGSIKDCAILLSIELPALGYATVYIVEGQPAEGESTVFSESGGSSYENQWFRVSLDKTSGYPASLFDKASGKELLQGGSYFLGELLALENIAHDEDEYLTGKFWHSSQFPSKACLSENGPLRATWTMESEFKNGYQRTHFRFYRDLARVDIMVELDWQGEEDIQIMQMFPFQSNLESQIHYGVPFGYTRFGGENPHWTKVHPSVRGVRDWVNLTTGQQNITLASEVIPFDFKNRVAHFEQEMLIQPILLKTTYSCHDQLEFLRKENLDPRPIYSDPKNETYPRPENPEIRWRQVGKHLYHFSVQVNEDVFDPARAARFSCQHQTPFLAFVHYEHLDQFPHLVRENIVRRLKESDRTLPQTMSFLACESRTIIPTWVKHAENGEGIILRCYEACGKKDTASFKTNHEISAAWRTDILEYDQEQLPAQNHALSITLAPYKIETMRFKLKKDNLQKNARNRDAL